MRIFTLSLALVILFTQLLSAQDTRIEELKQALEQAQDTSRIRILNELANALVRFQNDSALLYAQEALQLAEMANSDPASIESFLTIERVLRHSNQSKDSLLFHASQARDLALKIGDPSSLTEALLSLGKSYDSQFERQKAIDFFKQALQVAVENKDNRSQGNILNSLGRTFKYFAQPDSAEYYYLQSIEAQRRIGNREGEAKVLLNLGSNAAMNNQLDKAINYYQKATTILIDIGQKHLAALALGQIAFTYQAMAFYPSALDYYQQALDEWESMGDKREMALTLTRIGTIYELAGNPDKALPYFQKSLDLWEEQKTLEGQAETLNQIGNNYAIREKYDTALVYFFEALGLSHATKTASLRNIGNTYEKMDQIDSAEVYLQAALNLAKEEGNRHSQTPCMISLGAIYKRQGKIALAQSSLEEALAIIRTTGARDQLLEAQKQLYALHKGQNNFQQALNYHEAYKSLEDSLFNAQNTEKIVRLEAQTEFEQEKQQLEFEQERKNAKQKNFQKAILAALGIALLFILIIARYYRSKQRTNVELQRLNEDIRQKNDQLKELDEIKSRFFTNISHELRTPLTVIGGMAEQIKSAPQKWLDKGISLIIRNNTNLLNLVNQILDLRKLESGNLRLDLIHGDLINYLKSISESFQSLAESKGLKLHFLPEEPSLIMDYDKEKLLRVISNLLSNAIKFTPEGGNIYLRINTLEVSKTSRVFVLKVKDSGIGISPDKVPHVFDRFYQVDDSSTRKGEGTGIGLALSRELVRLMGGDITVKSEVNKGSTFSIQLPITHNAVLENEPAIPVAPIQSDWQLHQFSSQTSDTIPKEDLPTLLIIEDNPDLVQYLESFLEPHYQLLIANNGEEGIEKALEEIPDLIVSDVMMPKKDGLEVCETLKMDQLTSHIPIVLLTAKSDVKSRIAGLKRGADAYMAKPFSQKELLVRLGNLFELRQHLQQRYQSLDSLPPSRDINVQQEDAFVLRVKELVEDQIEDEHFGVPELCRAVGMSHSQLHRKIKALTNQPASHFIKATRLNKAKTLFQTTDMNITQVAFEVGFRDPSYFSRIFQETFGVKPKDFRK